MYSNRQLFNSTDIYNRRDFVDISQIPNVTVVDTSGASLNASDFVLKSGDTITGLIQFKNGKKSSKIIYNDGSIQEKAFSNERITQLEQSITKLQNILNVNVKTKIEGEIELDTEVLLKSNILELEGDIEDITDRITETENDIEVINNFITSQITYNTTNDGAMQEFSLVISEINDDLSALDTRITNNENTILNHNTKLLEVDVIHNEILDIVAANELQDGEMLIQDDIVDIKNDVINIQSHNDDVDLLITLIQTI
jgi:hypothetical protein